MFKSYQRWRRSRIIARNLIDGALWQATLTRLPFLRGLSNEEEARLRDIVVLFLHGKAIRGAAGLTLNPAMELLIAVQACILILNLDIDYYRGWVEIVVYPAQFVPSQEYTDEIGVVHHEREAHMGEAWLKGPVILSWDDVAASGGADGVNVVIHEFAHKLDMLNGDANGFPPLHAGMSRQVWVNEFSAAYSDFCGRVDVNERLAIDEYAAESPGEFFAVMSEAFFETPHAVREMYAGVYEQLKLFYRQDPVYRLS